MTLKTRIKSIKKFDELTKKDKLFYLSVSILIVFFIFKLVEFALSIKFGIPPDENTHMQIINFYSKFPLLIEEFPEMYVYGPLNHSPYLYYVIFAKISNVDFIGIEQVNLFRIVNILFSILTVIFSYKLTSLVTKSRLIKLTTMIIITNIPMYTFISGMINYDNLANLFGVLSTYYLIYYYRYSTKSSFLLFIIFTSLGLLTKITIIPLAFVSCLILLYILFLKLKSKKIPRKALLNQITKLKIHEFVLTLIAIFSASLVMDLYGRNLIEYKAIIPNCYSVTTYENCQLNPNIVWREELEPPKSALDPYHYINSWKFHMYDGTFGIFGHKKIFKEPEELIPFKVIIDIAVIGLIRRLSKKNKPILFLTIITLFYVLVLAYYQNYATYLMSGLTFLAVHGRYLFPIIAPLAILVSYSLVNLFRNRYIKYVIIIVIAMIFIWGDYIYYKNRVPDDWYRKTDVAEFIKSTNKYFRY